jgi:hypothetical protein
MVTGGFIVLFGLGILFQSICLTLIFAPIAIIAAVLEALKDAGFNIVTEKDLPMWGLPVEIVLARKP